MSKLSETAFNAANKTNAQFREKITRLTSTNISELINQLKTSTANRAEVEKLIIEINAATDKNKKNNRAY